MRYASRSKASDSGKLKSQTSAKPPHGAANDGEYAHLRSLNLLYDPGFELFMANSVEHWSNPRWEARTGNNQYTLPIFDPTCEYGQRWPSGECVRYWDIAQWAQWGEPYSAGGSIEKTAWIANRLDPYLGDFHLVWPKWDSVDPDGTAADPRPVLIQSPGLPPGYSARVEPGDIISWSVRTQLYGMRWKDALPYCTMSLFFYTDTGAPVVGFTSTTDLEVHVPGTEGTPVDSYYQEARVDATAPGGSYFLRAVVQYHNSVGWGGEGPTGDEFIPSVHIDSGVLSVW